MCGTRGHKIGLLFNNSTGGPILVHSLGLILESTLTKIPVTKTTFFHPTNITGLRSSLAYAGAEILIHVVVTSLWHGLVWSFQQTFGKFPVLTQSRSYQHISPISENSTGCLSNPELPARSFFSQTNPATSWPLGTCQSSSTHTVSEMLLVGQGSTFCQPQLSGHCHKLFFYLRCAVRHHLPPWKHTLKTHLFNKTFNTLVVNILFCKTCFLIYPLYLLVITIKDIYNWNIFEVNPNQDAHDSLLTSANPKLVIIQSVWQKLSS